MNTDTEKLEKSMSEQAYRVINPHSEIVLASFRYNTDAKNFQEQFYPDAVVQVKFYSGEWVNY